MITAVKSFDNRGSMARHRLMAEIPSAPSSNSNVELLSRKRDVPVYFNLRAIPLIFFNSPQLPLMTN